MRGGLKDKQTFYCFMLGNHLFFISHSDDDALLLGLQRQLPMTESESVWYVNIS